MTSLDVIRKAQPEAQDEYAMSMFATAIRQKMQRSRDKGRGGWIDCDEDILINGFAEHALKGNENNLLDLATFLMFMWVRGIDYAKIPPALEKARQHKIMEAWSRIHEDGQNSARKASSARQFVGVPRRKGRPERLA
ncbi:phage protein [Pseudomonas phage R12]|uniref:Phage protein n=1 Tax=Pseudomonas phage R12 TaxID=2562635 RepID=A0A455XAR9_9CAUD|nr:phage protein [Pseudomonas phage R12]BBJ26646.1 phage protein [Pseudomonas phage R12]